VGGGPVTASGVWGSFAPLLAAAAARKFGVPLLYVTGHLEQADDAQDDFDLFLAGSLDDSATAPDTRGPSEGDAAELLPAWEALPGEGAGGDEIAAERTRLCSLLQAARQPVSPPPSNRQGVKRKPLRRKKIESKASRALIMVAPIQALMQPVPTPEALSESLLALHVGQEHSPDSLAQWLVDRRFERVEAVEGPGEFALRGGILDVFSPGEPDPARIEFFGDRIESIRRFETGTQRSTQQLARAVVTASPDVRQAAPDQTTSFLNYLPPETLAVLDEPLEIQEAGRTFFERLDRPTGMFPVEAVLQNLQPFNRLQLVRFGKLAAEATFNFGVESLQRFESKAAEAVRELCELASQRRIFVFCENRGEQQRLTELIVERAGSVPDAIAFRPGLLHRGFAWPPARLVALAHHELFGRYQQRRRLRRVRSARPIESFADLDVGDLVVHVTHGIARYMGLQTLEQNGRREEYLRLRFAGKAVLHVPISQINMVQKYVGAGGVRPTLSKLGGTRWKKTKQRVEEALTNLAGELLRIQAARQAQPGIAYPADTTWQREFEEAFIYTETEDQVRVLEEIKNDMGRARPMDRLVCGDVGYGKTELAMRAAFKAVEYGKQVAVLVPTTVLAEQHYQTFRERTADFPFVIECLSRFRTHGEQTSIVKRCKAGQVDVVIGTHRLLSQDVGFANLGLVVIDEEQRFGVEHKERLKQLRTEVDVLTMTATPIPRTLHMSTLGIRDISALTTPPLDRRSIATRVCRWDQRLIREAILRELNRDGQVYFVHNLVHNIWPIAQRIGQIVPEARVTVGHGQMPEGDLERVMVRFVRGHADILVCTTIIESGIDIPNVNTIFINQADRYGLADLHQLRGRVGRYKHRAYAYLLLPEDRPVTPAAGKRLKAIEEFSELGAGFRIAMRDLEIRGAGNILGPEQSGHIAAVGYELYCQLLDLAVRRLRDEPAEPFTPVHLDLGVTGRVPRDYITSDRQRMEVYRRTATCRSVEDVEQLTKDLRDAFGPHPEPVETLLQQAEIRVLARHLKIRSIVVDAPDVIFQVDDARAVEKPLRGVAGTVRVIDPQTIHWRPGQTYLESPTLLAILRRRLRAG